MSHIYWDTMLFVYWLEDHPVHGARMQQIHQRMRERGDQLYTSAFTVGEMLTGIYKHGTEDLAATVKEYFRPPQVELVAFTPETAEHYGRIRSQHRISPADAIHLASAAQAGTDLFLTNDRALSQLAVAGIQFIAGLDVNLF